MVMGVSAVVGGVLFTIGVMLLVVVFRRNLFGLDYDSHGLVEPALGSALVIIAVGLVLMFWGILGRLLQIGFFGPG